ncbi:MAG: DUF3307 domain-containing protein [Clostridiales bacterium]|nr:DUF3307 domain-containing protein [Clostridiales bacterium]
MKFFLLLLAHLLGDFVFQTSAMAVNKMYDFRAFLKHCAVYAAFIFLALIWYGSILQILAHGAIITLSHFLVDMLRCGIQKRPKYEKKREFLYFNLDQLIHIAVLILFSFSAQEANGLGKTLTGIYIGLFGNTMFPALVIATAYCICLHPAGIFIKKVLMRLEYQKVDDSKENIPGFLIGVLERLCVLTLALIGQYTAVSFVIAAKSLARMKLLEEKEFAEKYLVGTLISVVIATLCGTAVNLIIN